jgi:uncharacterized protein
MNNIFSDRQKDKLLDKIVSFSRFLHDGGIPVNSSNLIDLCHSFTYFNIANRDDFYAATRANLLSNANDLEAFDIYFKHFWEKELGFEQSQINEDEADADSGEEDEANSETVYADTPPQEEPDTSEDASPDAYSPQEVLMRRDLGTMSEKEIDQARKLIAPLIALFAEHKSRRYQRDKRGRTYDFRRMLRSNAMMAGDSVKLSYRNQRIKKTRLMLLCDVSGSMQTYSQFFIQFIYALNRELSNFEVAVFSTRMTPITPYLKNKSVEESLELVSDYVHDWAGGTNIGASIEEFNNKYARDMLRSRTTMIILSDGWDRGDNELLKTEMKRLHRRCHKLIWLNPLLGNSLYKPLCQGIKTALPFLDYFLPAHNLESLAKLAKTLTKVNA